MITEFALAGGVVYGYNKLKDYNIKNTFKMINEDKKLGYKLIEVTKTETGHKLIVDLNHHGFSPLACSKDLFQTGYGCMVDILQNTNYKTATMDIIENSIDGSEIYLPIDTQPYEIYIGKSYKLDNLIVNLNDYPHVLVSGQPGCGKTEEIRLILTNLVHRNTQCSINIYFSDLSDVNDFSLFKKLEQTKGYARNIKDSTKLISYLLHIYAKRLSIFETHSHKNIIEYNKNNFHTQMPYIYLVLDEFADYFPTNKLEEDYELKVKCYNAIRHLVRKARKVGIFLIIGIQRPDTTVLDPSLRSGLCTKIGFSQNTDSSSLVVCDTTELTNIEKRQALLMYSNKREWFKSLTINDKKIRDCIKSSMTYQFPRKDYNKFLAAPIVPKPADENSSKKPKSTRKVKIDDNKKR